METSSLMWLQSPHRASEQHRTQRCLVRKSSQRQVRHTAPWHPLASLTESVSTHLHLTTPLVPLGTGAAFFQKLEDVLFSKAAGLVKNCYTLVTVWQKPYKAHQVWSMAPPFAGNIFSCRREHQQPWVHGTVCVLCGPHEQISTLPMLRGSPTSVKESHIRVARGTGTQT